MSSIKSVKRDVSSKKGLSIQTKKREREERERSNLEKTLEKQSLEIAGYLPSFHREARAFLISVSVDSLYLILLIDFLEKIKQR